MKSRHAAVRSLTFKQVEALRSKTKRGDCPAIRALVSLSVWRKINSTKYIPMEDKIKAHEKLMNVTAIKVVS